MSAMIFQWLFLTLPFVCVLLMAVASRFKEWILVACATSTFAVGCMLWVFGVCNNNVPYTLLNFSSGLHLSFQLDKLGIIFATMVSLLWMISSIYTIGYLKRNDKSSNKKRLSFYCCFALAIEFTLLIAFSGDLLTTFICYEFLTIVTYYLVTYKLTAQSLAAGRIYLAALFGSSVVLFLPALIIVWCYNGSLDFSGMSMITQMPSFLSGVVFAMFVYGIAKAALMPMHFWLPKAMVAPTPVSALLHAVAVVKSGIFVILKIIIYVFGVQNLNSQYLSMGGWLQYAAGFTIICASVIAMRQDNLKKLLAYSTISQLSYIIITASIFTESALKAATLQLISHAFAKITLFFVAGSIYTASSKQYISEMNGIGRVMPISMAAFSIAALSMIGVPPTFAFWSKFLILSSASNMFIISVLIISTVLNTIYFIPIIYNAYCLPVKDYNYKEPCYLMLAATVSTAIITIAMFFIPSKIFY